MNETTFSRLLRRSLFLSMYVFGPTALNLHSQSNSEIIARIDKAEADKQANLTFYEVTEHYQIYEQADDAPIGDVHFDVTYRKGIGKTYVQVGEAHYRKPFVQKAIARMIAGQRRVSQPAQRSGVLVTSDNYAMQVIEQGKEPQPHYICNLDRPTRKTRVVSIKPLHPGPGMIEGLIWVDPATGHEVRIEGIFSRSPNVFVGRPVFERDYTDQGDFALASSSCQISQSPFSHDRSQITYERYRFDK